MKILNSVLSRVYFALCLSLAPTALLADTNSHVSATDLISTNSATSAHRLGTNDKIQIIVYQEDDLDTTVTLDDKGIVMLPLLGKVKLGGLTVEAATEMIQAAYGKDYLVNPEVNIMVLQYAQRQFSVLGEVQRPGSFDMPENEHFNILEAIAMAGGYTRLGSPSKVTVRRVVNGETVIYKIDTDAAAREKSAKLFEILPDDIVNVGERTF